MTSWHIITGEYPPDIGGVADHTMLLAHALAAHGDTVDVWAPAGDVPRNTRAGVRVHRELGDIGVADLLRVSRRLDRFAQPRRVVVQWVPHAFRMRAVNVPFALWTWFRALRGDIVDLIVHEPYVPLWTGTFRQTLAGVAQRVMIAAALRAARRVWITVPQWESYLRPYGVGREHAMEWLPVPSNVPVRDDDRAILAVRAGIAGSNDVIVGHFGTYGHHITDVLERAVGHLLPRMPSARLLLIGKGSDVFADELRSRAPTIAGRVHATGTLDADALSAHLSACDVMLQPYPDGVSARRGSAMATLAHGRALVTTDGVATEPLWRTEQSVVLVPVGDTTALSAATESLLGDPERRRYLGTAARRMYTANFDLERTVSALRASGGDHSPSSSSHE